MKAVIAHSLHSNAFLRRGSDEHTRAFYPFDDNTIIMHSMKAARDLIIEFGCPYAIAVPLKNIR